MKTKLTKGKKMKIQTQYNDDGSVNKRVIYATRSSNGEKIPMIFTDTKGEINKDGGKHQLSKDQISQYKKDALRDNAVHVKFETNTGVKYLFFPDGSVFAHLDKATSNSMILPINETAYHSGAHNLAHPEM